MTVSIWPGVALVSAPATCATDSECKIIVRRH